MKLFLCFAAAYVVFAGLPSFAETGSHEALAMDHSEHCGLPAGEGTITSLDVSKSGVTIDHQPVAALGWPEMTMNFRMAKGIDLVAFAPGDRVHFLLAKAGKGEKHEIAALCGLDVSAGLHEACMGKMHETAMKLAADSGKSCAMEPMDHDSMKGMDHSQH